MELSVRRRRHGTGLLEVLVAIPLVAVIGTVAVQLLLTVHRQVVRDEGTIGAIRELRHGAGIISAELRGLRASDIVAWSDTSIVFDATVGLGVVCAAVAGHAFVTIVGDAVEAMPRSTDTDPDPLAAIWNQPPQPGDVAELRVPGETPADAGSVTTRSIRTTAGGADCAGSPLIAPLSNATVRLTFADSSPVAFQVGTPIRVARRTRYSLYRAGDGDWYLGRRTMGPAGWDVVQPVAGPLSSADDRGLRIVVRDRRGDALGSLRGIPARVSLLVRAPRRAGRAAPTPVRTDSLHIEVLLRAEPERGP